MSDCCARARRELIASLRAVGVDVPGMFDTQSATPAEPGIYPGGGIAFTELRPSAGRATQGAAPTPAAVCCPGGVAPHEFGSDDWNDNPEACELCNHREDHPIHQRGDEPQGTQSTARDPHCGLVHPHSAVARCPGGSGG